MNLLTETGFNGVYIFASCTSLEPLFLTVYYHFPCVIICIALAFTTELGGALSDKICIALESGDESL